MAATTEYTYDVFVSYSQTDQDWVHDKLLPEFDKAGVRYIDQLEFVLGRPKLIEIERAVRESRWTLLILTQSYLDSSWSQFDSILAGSYGLDTATWRTIPAIRATCELPMRLEAL